MPNRIPTRHAKRTFTTTARARPAQRSSQHVVSSSLIRSALSIEGRVQVTAPTFLLPYRAKLHQAAATQQDQSLHPSASNDAPPPSFLSSTDPSLSTPSTSTTPNVPEASTKSKDEPLVLSKSLQQLLPNLTAQKPHYITTHIHRFPYLVTAGDTLRLPFNMSGVSSGDILRLNRASLLGSRDYTLKAGNSSSETYDRKRTGEPNYLDERLFEVRARVMGIESSPMTTKEKTKRRNRKVKTVKSKHRYTVLKVMDVKVKTLDELMAENKGAVLLES